jgi:GNAT superfamily N-acetyltransferase
VLIGASVRGDGAADGFATALGAEPDLVEEDNRLRVTRLDRGLLERWVAGAPDGYSLLSWEGRAPEQLVAPMCEVLDAMNDAPMHSSLERMRFTPERYAANQAAREACGAIAWQAAVRHDGTGKLVAYTELGHGRHRPSMAEQGLTCVDPAHRGRGIGKWVKATNLLVTLDQHPEVQTIVTDNAGANEPMLAINRALGYQTLRTMQGWLLPVR